MTTSALFISILDLLIAAKSNYQSEKMINKDTVLVTSVVRGGLVRDADTARNLAKNFAAGAFEVVNLKRQGRLSVNDKGDCWDILGRRMKRAGNYYGPLRVLIRKSDGAVVDISLPVIMANPFLRRKRIRLEPDDQSIPEADKVAAGATRQAAARIMPRTGN